MSRFFIYSIFICICVSFLKFSLKWPSFLNYIFLPILTFYFALLFVSFPTGYSDFFHSSLLRFMFCKLPFFIVSSFYSSHYSYLLVILYLFSLSSFLSAFTSFYFLLLFNLLLFTPFFLLHYMFSVSLSSVSFLFFSFRKIDQK